MQRLVDLPWDEKKGTAKALTRIMPALNEDGRVQLLVAPGQGVHVVARIRVMLSRVRKQMLNQNKRIARFQLNTDVRPWTDLDGKRYDSIIIHKTKLQRHIVTEILEDLLDANAR